MTDELMKPEVVDAAVIEQLTRGEVDMQVATANRYPRSIDTFKKKAKSLAAANPDVAQSCFYSLPRGGKKIEGPSIRLAEIVASTYKNLRCETRIAAIGQESITAQATVWDMEANVLMRNEVQRRITDRNGNRYNQDMIVVTGNAASSIALRNAIFKVVPRAYVSEIEENCKRVALGGKSVDQAKADWVGFYIKRGVEESQILAVLGKRSVEDMDLEDVSTLQGLWTAISEGQTTLDDAFPAAAPKDGTHSFGLGKKKAAPPAKAEPKANRGKSEEPAKAKSKGGSAKPTAKPAPEPPHDPKTGEVFDETNPPPPDQEYLEF